MKNPLIFLFRKQFPFKLIIFEHIIEKLAPVMFGDHQDGVVMTGARHLNILVGKGGKAACFSHLLDIFVRSSERLL